MSDQDEREAAGHRVGVDADKDADKDADRHADRHADDGTDKGAGAKRGGDRTVVAAGLGWLGPGRVLVHRRPPDARFGAGALELPGGKLEPGEGPAPALRRELCEEWGPGASRLAVGPVAEVLHHVYPSPGPEVVLVVYHVDGARLSPGPDGDFGLTLEAGLSLLACEVAQLPVEEFLAADRPWVQTVASGQVRAPDFG